MKAVRPVICGVAVALGVWLGADKMAVSAATPPAAAPGPALSAEAAPAGSPVAKLSDLTPADKARLRRVYRAELAKLDQSRSLTESTVLFTPAFNYGPKGGPSLDAVISSGGLVRRGDVGLAVWQLQSDLNACLWCGLTEDGYFGDATYAAVKSFQSTWNSMAGGNLTVDGVVGRQTYAALMACLSGGF